MLTVLEIETQLKYAKLKHFEFANKPRKWLVYKPRKEKERKMI